MENTIWKKTISGAPRRDRILQRRHSSGGIHSPQLGVENPVCPVFPLKLLGLHLDESSENLSRIVMNGFNMAAMDEKKIPLLSNHSSWGNVEPWVTTLLVLRKSRRNWICLR
jgi:hypothetical protein